MGHFIVFEGPEGGGKTLQSGRLAERLRQEGIDVVQTREPGGTALGDEVRSVLLRQGGYTIAPEAEVLLLAAARAQHVRDVIRPALERGSWVVCDRFVDSTYAYQGGGGGLALGPIRSIQAFATGGLEPGIRILLDLPVTLGLQRRFADATSVNRIDRADLAYHQRVRDQYLALAAESPHGWVVVDAQGPPDVIQSNIWRQVRQALAFA